MSIKAAVLTISDRCAAGINEDKSGPLICQFLTSKGFLIVQRSVVPDIKHQIQVRLGYSKPIISSLSILRTLNNFKIVVFYVIQDLN
jgi:molybdopterin-biosynthesis enzyme MoeA-like protein